MMEDAGEVLQMNRDQMRKDSGLPAETASGGRSIQIGDNIHHHYVQHAAPKNGNLAKLALAAGLAATGVGLPAAAYFLGSGLTKPAEKTTERWDSKVDMEVVPPKDE